MTQKHTSNQLLTLAILVVLVIGVLFLANFIDRERKGTTAQETVEPACEWPCTAEDRMTAGAWFATLDAENTLEAQGISQTETPVP